MAYFNMCHKSITYLNIIHTEDCTTVIHVLLQIFFQIFKNKGKGLLSMHNVMQCNCKITSVSENIIQEHMREE